MKRKELANQDIRSYARESGVYLWEIADRFGISYDTFIRKMRHEMQEEDKKKAFLTIDAIRNDTK